MDRNALHDAAALLGIFLTTPQLDAFQEFEEHLYAANALMNLTRVPREECWLRHFLDSLLVQEFLPHGAHVLDIGSGPGFPSWPLANARPDLFVTALDSSAKMLAFLKENSLTNLTVINERAEEWGVREKFDVVTGRAVAPLAIQLELSARAAKIGGLVVPLRTRNDLVQITSGKARKLNLTILRYEERVLPGTDVVRVFPLYEKTGATGPDYPRRWAEIKHSPLF